jgi:putative transposase
MECKTDKQKMFRVSVYSISTVRDSDHAAKFVKLRTADSLSREVVMRMQRELEEWLLIEKIPLKLTASTVGVKRPNHHPILGILSVADRNQFRRLADQLPHGALYECHDKCGQ